MLLRKIPKAVPVALIVGTVSVGSAPCAFGDTRTGGIYVRPLAGFNDSVRKTRLMDSRGEVMSTIVYGVENRDARVAVCGMVLHSIQVDRRAFAGAMANSGVESGGVEFTTDLRYFREFIAPDQLLLACKVTGYEWQPQYAQQAARLVFRGEFQR